MQYRFLGYFILAWMVSVPCLYAAYDSPNSRLNSLKQQKIKLAENHDNAVKIQKAQQPLSKADEKLKSIVQGELKALPWNTDEINVIVLDGKVTLNGKVTTIEQMSLVEEKIQNIDGVTLIDNQLEIELANPQGRWNNRDFNR